jgi:hypothetical protein
MECGKEIAPSDLGAKICIEASIEEKNPFFVPIAVSEPAHLSQRICGQCAKGKDSCPRCNGRLVPTELVANMNMLNFLGEEEFKKRRLSGTFRTLIFTGKDIHFSYILNGTTAETFWREL